MKPIFNEERLAMTLEQVIKKEIEAYQKSYFNSDYDTDHFTEVIYLAVEKFLKRPWYKRIF